ncbi:MAG TPA: hypothetical protein VEB39_08370 [Sphingomicrobium sp.]|nr:hypothetical protein [Sphingomicrobium sp.]
MQAELEVAIEDGRPLAFAMGCVLAAWRELPAHPEGRFALASHLLAIGLIVPIAALTLSCGLLGYPYLAFGEIGIWGFLAGSSDQILLLNDGERAVAPALTLLVLIVAASQLLLAWFVLERDWERVAAIGRFNAATLTTFAVVASLLPLMGTSVLLPAAGLAVEMLAVFALAQWHQRPLCCVPGVEL